ncbi:MAG: type II toxin-antitoxin system RelE/ParE family toxin [Akkermansiaceae bacterium]|nr:type II toxin-antitoxin system RelE/ParE family toxin [Akkermansiaceae bacterium]
MSFKVEFLAGAAGDLLSIYREISDFSDAHAESFSTRLDRRLSQLSRFPELGPPFSERFRRLVLGKFPYAIFYSTSGDRIFIHGIFHLQINPLLIKTRLKS